MSPSSFITLGFAVTAVFIFWTLSATSSSPFARNFPRLYNKRICLLIAHPDDEAMFFAPTVLALTKPELGNHLKILCLSSGDADGLGHIRKKELQKSAVHLGLRNESDVLIVDDPARFPDSMSATWSESDVSSLLASAFAPEMGEAQSGSRKRGATGDKPPVATIDVLLTFDRHGISNHPNHRSLYHGAVHFLRTLMKDKPGYTCPISLYTLTTTNILRKYIGVLDAPLSMARGAVDALSSSLRGSSRTSKEDPPARLLFVSSVGEWMTAQSAMVKAHQSQMVWFRYGWITFGRYMAVNDLKREKV
ncbi:N-acetylglucosaminyl-phosphatidylinositol deacetylase [Aspergillus nomiae NRRL 13137]|uniref:N-acetylglucosaminylphosphatidylinositol deacetylase n=1 Tax=Aspergillus nomiae NRRL (strain ATCC 15546 / NRRL 13137 / CBS 260.88 / M93) TaxID=1509407 RepID=A0A0L1J0G0_ASPN3|nr:N-acetylglucosaminyl-phosphatidylinositol deacetylase [Aspergillus nomiae NRRL 13137]KNG85254.1 N-acetylglucosaminyl-phosphatidylinositol deacetylase [Aspergillus nomiae NRRL 13137]